MLFTELYQMVVLLKKQCHLRFSVNLNQVPKVKPFVQVIHGITKRIHKAGFTHLQLKTKEAVIQLLP